MLSVLVILTAVAVLFIIYQVQKNKQWVATPVKPTIRVILQAEVDAINEKQRAELKRQKAFARKVEADKDFAENELQRLIADNPRAKRLYEIVKSSTLPIEFYGKVVDEGNNPIANVQVKYSIGAAYGMGQPIHGMEATDDNGFYVIRGEGAIVSLYSFVAWGYRFPNVKQHFFSTTESGRPNKWRDHIATNPYVTVGVPK